MLGLVQDPLEPLRGELVGEVDQRPGRGGDREAVDRGDVGGRERARAVHADQLRTVALAQGDHVDPARGHAQQFRERGGGAVAEHREQWSAARQDRRP